MTITEEEKKELLDIISDFDYFTSCWIEGIRHNFIDDENGNEINVYEKLDTMRNRALEILGDKKEN